MSEEGKVIRVIVGDGSNAERDWHAKALLTEAIKWIDAHEHWPPLLVRDIVVDLAGGTVTLYIEEQSEEATP